MIDEHFGIALVEFLAAGLLVVAHNSAGPKMDILNISPIPALSSWSSSSRLEDEDVVMLDSPRRSTTTSNEDTDCVAATFGYLCSTSDGFSRALFQCLSNSSDAVSMLRKTSTSLKRFNSNEMFGRKCTECMDIGRLLQI